MPVLGLRKATEADLGFLVRLRRDTMWSHYETAGVPIDEAMQEARVHHRYDAAMIVTRNGEDVGLLKVARDADPWELIQIQLLPSCQGQGLGAELIGGVVREAREAGVGVVLTVLRGNPAKALYERAGFRVIGSDELEYWMRCDAVST